MKERGFMPFTAVGVIIVMLVVAMVGRATLSCHERSVYSINGVESDAVLTSIAGIQNDLKHVARYAVYKALWDVSKHAEDYADAAARERAIENLALNYFLEFVEELPRNYQHSDARVELEISNSVENFSPWNFWNWLTSINNLPRVDIRAEGDFVSADVKLPRQTRIRARTWDNSLVVTLPYENFDVFVDSRYYLLQDRMDEFIGNGFEEIRETWRNLEYILAWGGAWLSTGINLSDARSRAIFELAWARQELETFGSADYIATAIGLCGAGGSESSSNDVLSTICNPPPIIPLRAVDVDTMNGFIDRALGFLNSASTDLTTTKRHLICARDAIIQIPDNVENTASRLENARIELEEAVTSISHSKNRVRDARQQFDQLVEFTAQAAGSDVVMAAIHDSITRRTIRSDYPSLQEQVVWGAAGAENKISELETMAQTQLRVVSTNNILLIKNSISDLYDRAEALIQSLLSEPSPKRSVEFDSYAEPGANDIGAEPTRNTAPVYIDGEQDGTIGAVKIVLQNTKANLEKMRTLSEMTEPSSSELQDVDIDEGLKQKLGADTRGFLGIDRERLYELLPPAPIRDQPGLSVFHDFNISRVSHEREDPAGRLFGQNAPPTPIPLWFIGLTLWYAQWEITLELANDSVEEIFDFANPTLPRPHELAEVLGNKVIVDVHKPLAYRYEAPNRSFSFKLIIISLRGFSIAQS
jgi:hypothetical protein